MEVIIISVYLTLRSHCLHSSYCLQITVSNVQKASLILCDPLQTLSQLSVDLLIFNNKNDPNPLFVLLL